MKRIFTRTFLMCLYTFIFGCRNDIDPNNKLIAENGFSLSWYHGLYATEGRGLLFSFESKTSLKNDYDLEFDYSIKNSVITVRLTKVIDKGGCPQFPGWGDPDLCTPNGKIYIPERLLPSGKYSLDFIADNIKVTSQLDITDERVSINIPSNPHLSTSINEVYPIPKGLVFGNIVYSESKNEKYMSDLINGLSALGLTPATIANHPYQYLNTERNAHLQKSSWEPDKHSVSILFKTNGVGFKSIFETAKTHFERAENKLTISIMSSNGDQTNMNPSDGIHVVYGT